MMHQSVAPSVFDARQERQATEQAAAAEEARIRGDRAALRAIRDGGDDGDSDADDEPTEGPPMDAHGRPMMCAGEDDLSVMHVRMPWFFSAWVIELWDQLPIQYQVYMKSLPHTAKSGATRKPTIRCVLAAIHSFSTRLSS